jgi:hypothetical protein
VDAVGALGTTAFVVTVGVGTTMAIVLRLGAGGKTEAGTHGGGK